MSISLILFLLLALVAIASAVGTIINEHAIYSALFLIINFATVAFLYLLLGAPFIAMAQVTVYAGAIMVLFLFVIMLLGSERQRRTTTLAWQLPVGVLLGAILIAEAAYMIYNSNPVEGSATVAPAFGSPVHVGEMLFNQYLLPFEVTSVLLLVGMIGAIVLTKRKRDYK